MTLISMKVTLVALPSSIKRIYANLNVVYGTQQILTRPDVTLSKMFLMLLGHCGVA